MKPTDYIQVLPALSNEICESLITTFEDKKDQHLTHNNKVQNFTEVNLNRNCSRNDLKFLVNIVEELFDSYTDVWCPVGSQYLPQKYAFEELRLKRYNEGGDCFRPHVDVGDLNSSKRFLAFLFYLNDDFEGGGTTFHLPEAHYIKPVRGNCLIFPPTWQYPHEGMTVLSGTKYIMSTYLHYV